MNLTHTDESFRQAVQALLHGHAPSETDATTFGSWAQCWHDLRDVWRQGGTTAVLHAFDSLVRDPRNRTLAELMAGAEPAPTRAPQEPAVPPLPAAATAIYAHQAPCAHLLTRYADFGTQASPAGPRALHELAMLSGGSILIARRLVYRAGVSAIYPNLFAIYLAPSSLYAKTTSLRVLQELFRAMDLTHLLLPARMTPEAFVQEMSLSVPPTFSSWDQHAQQQWIRERAFAGQRSAVLDEVASLFDALRREYNAELLGLLLKLYDCPDFHSEQTISRGRITVTNAYLSLFGITTPGALREHLQNPAYWTNGLWSRFALLIPDADPVWAFLPDALVFPPDIVRGARRLFELFPVPVATLLDMQEEGRKTPRLEITGSEPPAEAVLAEGVRAAWEAYSKAVRFDLLRRGDVDEALHPNYARLGILALKVAMILAAMDCEALPVVVERRHFARAQQIVEQWRVMLHRVWDLSRATAEAQLTDRLVTALAHAGPTGARARDLFRALHIKAKEGREALQELQRDGQVESFQHTTERGRPVEMWRLVAEA